MSAGEGARARAAAVLALCCASLGVAACSDGGGGGASGPPSAAPTMSGMSATAEASAGATSGSGGAGVASPAPLPTGSTAADLTGMSTADYEVVSVPEGLDELQVGAAAGFIHYDQVTGNIWRSGGGIEAADEVTLDPELTQIRDNFAARSPGEAMIGQKRIAVTAVDLTDGIAPGADVYACADRTGISVLDGAGSDVTPEESKIRYLMKVSLVLDRGVWKATEEVTVAGKECTLS